MCQTLQKWNKDIFGNVQQRIKALKQEICLIRELPRTDELAKIEVKASIELDEWFAREELLWKQRARIDWLKEGDCNAALFKAKATWRKKRKIIKEILKQDGTVANNSAGIMNEFSEYFYRIFSTG